MRNLILFLTRNYYLLLFLSLETFAIFLVVRNNHFQRSHFLNSSNAISGNIYETYSDITDYFSLKETNKKLADENVLLRNQLRQSYSPKSGLQVTVKDSALKQSYIYLTAKVVNNSTNRRNNYLTLNAGSNQGVKNEMAVISSEGIVGIVRDVSGNFCSVMSVLHESMRVPVTIQKFGENSILTWNGEDEWHAKMDRVPSHLHLKKGDVIVTSSYSSIFPEGIMVGTIENFKKIAGNTFYNVTVKLSTNFNRLSYVNVVNNLKKEEQTGLEKAKQHD
ncbi:MAG: rod shape-determining protein MreC [Bacteroidetes bacterium]|nr:MAG: rod shape-determining protein MreC [Bacteroidota bacterium]